MAALIGTTSFTASANPWRPENNEHKQPTLLVPPPTHSDKCGKCGADNSTWEFLSKLDDIRENTNDIQTLVENIKSFDVKTATRDFVVSDVQVMCEDISLTSTTADIDVKDIDGIVKVYYDEGKSWVEFPINSPSKSDIIPMSTNGNNYGFTLPLDRSDLLTNCLTCRFGCEVNGVLCEWCIANNQEFAYRDHLGQDMFWDGILGAEIRAVADGFANYVGYDYIDSGYGNYVVLTHSSNPETKTLYAHMLEEPLVEKFDLVNQGDVLGYVGATGKVMGEHLHFEVIIDGVEVDPIPYLQGAVPYGSSSSGGSTVDPDLYLYAPGTYKICDGPLTLRAVPNSSTTSYGTLANGVTVIISEIQKGDGSFVFGKISSGVNAGKWIALGTTGIEMYAANTSVKWRVFDGPLNIRQTASTSSQSYGTIANGSTFNITDVITSGDFILAKIASSPSPTLASGSTCTVANAKNHWLALEYCEPIR